MAAGGGGSRGDRPEHKATASSFYSGDNAAKYTAASRIVDVQTTMAERCLELVNFPASRGPQLVLDIGCGSGLSGGA
jgi:18S rRNA (guanine1575-N7)-methyltransferase